MAVLDPLHAKLDEVFTSLDVERQQIEDAIAAGVLPPEEVEAFAARLDMLKSGIEGLVTPPEPPPVP